MSKLALAATLAGALLASLTVRPRLAGAGGGTTALAETQAMNDVLVAQAAQSISASCVATEMLATNEKKGIDGKLDKYKSLLAKPPLSAFDTFKLIGEETVTVEKGKLLSAKLTNGGGLRLVMKDRKPPAKEGGKVRLRLTVDYENAKGKQVVTATHSVDSGETFFPVAGESYQNGTYVLALTCSAS